MAVFYGLNDKTNWKTTVFCGLQHVLAMFVGIITPPLIIAGALGVTLAETGFLERTMLDG